MLHPERFSRSFGDAVRRAGLPTIRLHDLRHGWATMALSAGVHPKVVQERLGHANIGVTLDTYSDVTGSCTTTRPRRSRPCSPRRVSNRLASGRSQSPRQAL
jgi:integrase